MLLMKLRAGVNSIVAVCSKHKSRFLDFYTGMQLKCSDPFHKHEQPVKPTKEISMLMHLQSKAVSAFTSPLVPGQKLCKRCFGSVVPLLEDIVPEEPEEAPTPTPPSTSSSQTSSQGQKDYFPTFLKEAGSVRNVIFGPPPSTTSGAGPSRIGEISRDI